MRNLTISLFAIGLIFVSVERVWAEGEDEVVVDENNKDTEESNYHKPGEIDESGKILNYLDNRFGQTGETSPENTPADLYLLDDERGIHGNP